VLRGAAAGLLLAASAAAALAAAAPAPSRGGRPEAVSVKTAAPEHIALPAPQRRGRMTLEEALAARRSVREFTARALEPHELSQLLWAAQGVSSRDGLRTAPSAGALYPLELYVATAAGLFHYDPSRHAIERRSGRDLRRDLARAALGQQSVHEAPAVFVIAALEARTAGKYRGRAQRYVLLEAGHAAQNLLLEATALGLGGVPVGAFDDDAVHAALALARGEQVLYLVPVGQPR